MSRSIVILGDRDEHHRLAAALGRALGRRVISSPSVHEDEVIVLDPADVDDLDLDLACVLAPAGADLDGILGWALERGDVLTRSEHEQVMP